MNTLPELLRELRNKRSVTQDQVGEAIVVSGSLIAAFEQGRLIPQPDTAARLDEFFGSDQRVRKAAAKAAEAREKERERRRLAQAVWFRPWAQLEESATTLRYYEASLIPGLLQTEEYARSVLDSGPRGPREVDEQLAVRMERQSVVLGREDPAICVFIRCLPGILRRCGRGGNGLLRSRAGKVDPPPRRIDVHYPGTGTSGVRTGVLTWRCLAGDNQAGRVYRRAGGK